MPTRSAAISCVGWSGKIPGRSSPSRAATPSSPPTGIGRDRGGGSGGRQRRQGDPLSDALHGAGSQTGRAAVHACEAGGADRVFRCVFELATGPGSFLKVQDGCDYRCSYCTIPAGPRSEPQPAGRRSGRARPRAIAAGAVSARSCSPAINAGDFGRTTGESFLDLLRALDRRRKGSAVTGSRPSNPTC